MYSVKAFASILLFATACLGSPIAQNSFRPIRASRPSNETFSRENSDTLSFTNWAGAILQSSGVTSVTGTFIVPNPKVPSGGDSSTEYCGSAWVGIDGDSDVCPNSGLIQAGVTWCIQDSAPSFQAWYEWFLAQDTITFDDYDVEAGDEIKVTITATSTSTGQAVLENLTQGTSIKHTWYSESPTLCEATAEWIVEDFTDIVNSVKYPAPFANYGQVTFTDNSATVNGQSVGVDGAEPANMVVNGTTFSQSTVSNGQVIVTYEG